MPVRSALLPTIAGSDLCLWSQDPADGRIGWSPGVAAALGLPSDRRLDAPSLLERLHPDDRRATLDVIREAMAMRRAFRHESRLQAERGAGCCLMRGGYHTAPGRKEAILLGTIESVTAIRKQAAQLQARQRCLLSLGQEVRTPRTAILGFAELLALRIEQEPLREYARAIERSAQRLKGMLDDVLDVARIDAGAVMLRAEAAGDNARFVFEDSGQGIDPSFLPHAFEPPRQQSSGWGRRFGGSGLGFSIACGLVQLRGGSLRLESRIGQGTSAMPELPRLLASADLRATVRRHAERR